MVYKASDSTFGAAWRWIVGEVFAAYNFFLQNALVRGIFSGIEFVQNIWVLGSILRLFIWCFKKIFALASWPIVSLFGARFLFRVLSTYISNLELNQGQDQGTGGSLLPKILFSLFILSTKIGWAMKILKNRDNFDVNRERGRRVN